MQKSPLVKQLLESLRNPFVIASLILGILGAPPLWYSGIALGNGQEGLALLLFAVWVILYSIDGLITLTLLINSRK
jgi:hypothetical protein